MIILYWRSNLTASKDNVVDFNRLHSSRRPTVRTPTKQEARRFPPGQYALRPGIIGTLLKLARHQKIFSEGDAADHFYLVVSGVVRTYTFLPDGRRIIDGFH